MLAGQVGFVSSCPFLYSDEVLRRLLPKLCLTKPI